MNWDNSVCIELTRIKGEIEKKKKTNMLKTFWSADPNAIQLTTAKISEISCAQVFCETFFPLQMA